jgi:hypothetical protein
MGSCSRISDPSNPPRGDAENPIVERFRAVGRSRILGTVAANQLRYDLQRSLIPWSVQCVASRGATPTRPPPTTSATKRSRLALQQPPTSSVADLRSAHSKPSQATPIAMRLATKLGQEKSGPHREPDGLINNKLSSAYES